MDPLEEALPDETSLELDLDRSERARLLEQALALLPAQTAQMLAAHYLQESSHAEIAEQMGVTTGAVAVRLQRGKQTLQRLLRTRLQEEALAFDLLPRERPAWEETNIWCATCGQRRLLGQFQRGTADARFVLRCPHCHQEPGRIMVGHDLTQPFYAAIIGSTKTYKPAYSRLITGLAPYYLQAVRQAHSGNATSCLACGKPAQVQVTSAEKTSSLTEKAGCEIVIHCPACGWVSNMALSGLVMALPEAQRFWRDHPRMLALPVQQVEAQGLPAYVSRLRSLSGSAELAVISRRDTLAPVAVHANTHL